MPTDPLWLPTLSYDESELRKMDLLMVMADGTSMGARGGIRPGDPGLTVTVSAGTVSVSAGTAQVYRSGQGVYRVQLAASSPGSLAAANASFSRIDLVYLRVWDTAVDSSGLRKADTVLLTGTASATPVAPTPGGSEIYIPLATITVPSTGSGGTGAATVSSAVRAITVAPGGILPMSSAADLAASGLYAGQTRYNATRGILETWTGSAWVADGDTVSYTPTWTAATTAPALGNGTLDGKYALTGRQCTVRIFQKWGSTTTNGSGSFQWSLPFTPASGDASDGATGSVYMGVGLGSPGTALMQTGGGNANKVIAVGPSTNQFANATTPASWASGSYIIITLSYRIA